MRRMSRDKLSEKVDVSHWVIFGERLGDCFDTEAFTKAMSRAIEYIFENSPPRLMFPEMKDPGTIELGLDLAVGGQLCVWEISMTEMIDDLIDWITTNSQIPTIEEKRVAKNWADYLRAQADKLDKVASGESVDSDA